jgi:hypothetical protein
MQRLNISSKQVIHRSTSFPLHLPSYITRRTASYLSSRRSIIQSVLQQKIKVRAKEKKRTTTTREANMGIQQTGYEPGLLNELVV